MWFSAQQTRKRRGSNHTDLISHVRGYQCIPVIPNQCFQPQYSPQWNNVPFPYSHSIVVTPLAFGVS